MSDFEGGSFGSRPEMYGVGEARRRFPDPGDCPNGCGCRRNTNDPDRNDCACDGPCTMGQPDGVLAFQTRGGEMDPYYADDTVTLLHGDALACARTLPDASVQTIVTSPPYFGLRDYGEEEQMGVEATPAEYVERTVSLFGELRRVLSEDGTLWLNLGDSYIAQQLVGIPWMVALALKADGWRLRSDIIWSKPDAMPEGHVKNRPTKAHEYLFLFAKSDRYFFDSVGITEPVQHDHLIGKRRDRKHDSTTLRNDSGSSNFGKATRIRRSVWTVPNEHFPGDHFAVYPTDLIRPCVLSGSRLGDTVLDPFSGSGTTGMVATQEGRNYIGFDLNSDYLDLSLRTRFAQPTLNLSA